MLSSVAGSRSRFQNQRFSSRRVVSPLVVPSMKFRRRNNGGNVMRNAAWMLVSYAPDLTGVSQDLSALLDGRAVRNSYPKHH